MSSQIAVAGIDGCRAGWVIITATDGRILSCEVAADLRALADRVAAGDIAVAGIDMPIGLPAARRESDFAARRWIGPRRSSVFPTPTRVTLDHQHDYPAALAASRAAFGIGVSKQAFNLLPKIAHLDQELTRTGTDKHILEVHPECSFVTMNNGAHLEAKRSPTGAAQRRELIASCFGDTVLEIADAPPAGAAADDVLDACAVAWSAQRITAGDAIRLGDAEQTDAIGRPCSIWV